MIVVGGGLGDAVCTEPTIRFAIDDLFGDVSVATYHPEVFAHLKDRVKRIYNLRTDPIPLADYLVYKSHDHYGSIQSQFFQQLLIHSVNYPCLAMFGRDLPPKYWELNLKITREESEMDLQEFVGDHMVLMHPGKHWQSKTIPASWWQKCIRECEANGLYPVIVGDQMDSARGVLDFSPCTDRVYDLRNKLSLSDLMWLCVKSKHVITNDSAPLHIAAAGEAKIAYLATVKQPHLLTHMRNGQMGYNMKDFSLGGVWDVYQTPANCVEAVDVARVLPVTLESWLPNPSQIIQWFKT